GRQLALSIRRLGRPVPSPERRTRRRPDWRSADRRGLGRVSGGGRPALLSTLLPARLRLPAYSGQWPFPSGRPRRPELRAAPAQPAGLFRFSVPGPLLGRGPGRLPTLPLAPAKARLLLPVARLRRPARRR